MGQAPISWGHPGPGSRTIPIGSRTKVVNKNGLISFLGVYTTDLHAIGKREGIVGLYRRNYFFQITRGY